jgi:hypothetical protein
MKFKILKQFFLPAVMAFTLITCTSGSKKTKNMEAKAAKNYEAGTFGYDLNFLKAHKVDYVELKDPASKAALVVIPRLQGRVMTSSADGNEGKSFGWINYKFFEAGTVSNQFNPYGGEERFWLGPEGGPYSIFFPEGKEQVFENWKVPALLDTEPFEVEKADSQQIVLTKNTMLQNASGTKFKIGIRRSVSLLSRDSVAELFGVKIPEDIGVVGYQSKNTITNTSSAAWIKSEGLLSVWMLCMFNPSPATTVFIPYQTEGSGAIVHDDYFGKVPADRLKVDNGTIFFKIDGKLRSKIGLPPERAKGICGSYDSEQHVLTLLGCPAPKEPKSYVNSKWGKQDDPYSGDMINSYNDGPVADGSVMGPFYEIETSSPAADLSAGQSLTHVERIVHLQGDPAELAGIVNDLFGLKLEDIVSKFRK